MNVETFVGADQTIVPYFLRKPPASAPGRH
jgi:hypothetical protein